MITPVELAAATSALLVVLAMGTHGSHLGTVFCLLGAWWHDPVLLLTGVVFCALTRPWHGDGGSSSNGRTKHA